MAGRTLLSGNVDHLTSSFGAHQVRAHRSRSWTAGRIRMTSVLDVRGAWLRSQVAVVTLGIALPPRAHRACSGCWARSHGVGFRQITGSSPLPAKHVEVRCRGDVAVATAAPADLNWPVTAGDCTRGRSRRWRATPAAASEGPNAIRRRVRRRKPRSTGSGGVATRHRPRTDYPLQRLARP